MHLLLLVAFPLLYLVNPFLAMVALVAAIAVMYFQRTQAAKRQSPRRPAETAYKAGYED